MVFLNIPQTCHIATIAAESKPWMKSLHKENLNTFRVFSEKNKNHWKSTHPFCVLNMSHSEGQGNPLSLLLATKS